MMKEFLSVVLLVIFLGGCQNQPKFEGDGDMAIPDKIDFNFHVRPILSDRCYSCHGPDENTREADLRLDTEEGAFGKSGSGNGYAIRKRKPAKSLLVKRILSSNEEIQMPPPESNLTLSEREKAVLVKWIRQGAEWKDHWAFTKPVLPNLPEGNRWSTQNQIDLFIQDKLRELQLEPQIRAEPERLLRRVHMDLTGLPPSLDQIQSFTTDPSKENYERIVDELLASDECAERLAMEWMDVARYADSHGMHADGWRMMWPWRDWVIQAFQNNMPYDEFVSYQLAGDLFDNASYNQKLATAFNRNHPMTAEGGVIDEEFRLQYVFDRTETTSTALLGLTIGCARCHDHKFDPISQEEYFQFAAFYNNIKELGMTGDDGNYGPMLQILSDEQQEHIQKLRSEIQQLEAKYTQEELDLTQTSAYINSLQVRPNDHAGYYPLEFDRPRRAGDKERDGYFTDKINSTIFADGNPLSFSQKRHEPVEGKVGNCFEFTGDYDNLLLLDVGMIDSYDEISAGLWINTTKKEENKLQTLLCSAGDKNNFWRGWEFFLDDQNHLNVRLIHSLPHNYIHIRTTDTIVRDQWTHVGFSYDGSMQARGLQLYINGQKMDPVIEFDHLYKSIYPVSSGAHFKSERPVRVGISYRAFTGEAGVFKGRMDEIEIFHRNLSAEEMNLLPSAVKSTPSKSRVNSRSLAQLKSRLKEKRKSYIDFLADIDEIMVMEEMPQPRPMFVYDRGEYSSPKHEVFPATPQAVLAFPDSLSQDRLGLTQWLFNEENPLTARVTVNRYWQMMFGKGLVSTPQDFGVQGALPTHPELLDWLAVTLMDNNWDIKKLLRLFVLSSTYQQSSKATIKSLEKDPSNDYYSHSPSYRWPAEIIRDNALAASGLLVKEIGGPSVRPYQPEGLWIEKGNFSHRLLRYKETQGDSLYRRSMYTFIKRTSPHPAMTIFDAPARDVCTVKRENTNTPLQSLVLLNDPQFVEAAKKLAERVLISTPESIEQQLNTAFLLSTGRSLAKEEIDLLQSIYTEQLATFRKNEGAAQELLATGESIVDPELPVAETAAMTMVANTILNHDDTYMKR